MRTNRVYIHVVYDTYNKLNNIVVIVLINSKPANRKLFVGLNQE